MIDGLEPYPSMKDSGVMWLGAVPEHWEVRRLKHAFRRIVGGSTPASTEPTYWDGDVVWVTPADISRTARLATSLRRITREGLRSCSSELVPPGSIVVTSRAPVGNVAIAETALSTNQGCKALVATAAVINPVFGFHVLNTLRGELQSLATGTTFTEISTSRLCAVAIPLPWLPEQAAIVRFLDHADRRIRRYIRVKQKLIKLLEELKAAIIHRAVTRGIDPNVRLKPSGVAWLGSVPEHWEVVPLHRAAVARCDGPFGSGLKSTHYTSSGVRVVRLQNIGHAEFHDSNRTYISPAYYATLGDHDVEEGDLLIAGLGDARHPAGRACVAPASILPAMVKADCFRFRLRRDRLDPTFAALQLTATSVDASPLLSTGATRQRTNLQSTGSRAVAIPSMSEQRAIVEHTDSQTASLALGVQIAEREIELLREYRTRLIADVVTGKLDVREAAAWLPEEADEPEPLDEAQVEGDAEESDTDGVPEEAAT